MGRAHLGALVGLLGLSLAVPTSGAVVDAGMVAVEVDANPTPDCVADLGALDELCPVAWDQGDAPLPGDDRITVAKYIDEARVILRVPGVPAGHVGVNLSEVRVQHPANRILNSTWLQVNDTLPPEVRHYVAFESRPRRDNVTGTWQDSDEWGVFLPLNVTGEPIAWVAVCWDICQISNHENYFQGDEDGFRPFPSNVFLGDGGDTDHYLRRKADEVGACLIPQVMPAPSCLVLSAAREQMEPALGLYESLTPTVAVGFQFNRTVVQVTPPPASPLGDAGSTAPLAPSAAAGAAGAPGGLQEQFGPEPAEETLPAASRLPLAPARGAESEPGPASPASVLTTTSPALLPWVLGAGLVGFAWLLYHRLRRERALEQVTRRRIHDMIREEPGIRLGTIAGRLDLAYPTVEQHMRVLERFGLVAKQGNGQKHYFVLGAQPKEELQLHVELLATPSVRAVYEFLHAHGREADLSSLIGALGLSPSTVSEAASKLSGAGVIERVRVHRRVVLRLPRGTAPPEGPPARGFRLS